MKKSYINSACNCSVDVLLLAVIIREKNFSKSDIVGSSVSVFDFSPSGWLLFCNIPAFDLQLMTMTVGKVLAIGSEDGSVAIIDLESTNSVTAMTEEQLPSDVSTIAE